MICDHCRKDFDVLTKCFCGVYACQDCQDEHEEEVLKRNDV